MPHARATCSLPLLALRVAAVRAGGDRPGRDLGHRGRDLRHRLHGAQHPGRLHRPHLVRPRRLVRAGRLCGGHVAARPAFPARSSCRWRWACWSWSLLAARVRLPDPAPARRVLLAADAGAGGDALFGRVPLDRGHRRRERPRRHHAAAASPACRFDSAAAYYALVAAIGFAAVLALWRFHRSPLGSVLVAIRENEQRARFIGYPTNRYKLIAFVVSADAHRAGRHAAAVQQPHDLGRADLGGRSRASCWRWSSSAACARSSARRSARCSSSSSATPVAHRPRTGCSTSACCSSPSSCSRRPASSACTSASCARWRKPAAGEAGDGAAAGRHGRRCRHS